MGSIPNIHCGNMRRQSLRIQQRTLTQHTTVQRRKNTMPLTQLQVKKSLRSRVGLACGGFGDFGFPIADGQIAYLNAYDMKVYSLGKGPSAMTVTAPDVATTVGTPIVIRGTVTDISAGTKQDEQAARFPNGVPAVSDESQAAWMEYVYMQKAKPTDATGVTVTLSVVDCNGNYRTIGTAHY